MNTGDRGGLKFLDPPRGRRGGGGVFITVSLLNSSKSKGEGKGGSVKKRNWGSSEIPASATEGGGGGSSPCLN